MKNIILGLSIIVLIGVISGCGESTKKVINNENQENIDIQENVEVNTEENVEEHIGDQNDESVQEILGDDKSSDIDDTNESDAKKEECEDGFVYNTELKKCFKVGLSEGDEATESKIDSVVKECIDKGGIYNAQAEKCFVN